MATPDQIIKLRVKDQLTLREIGQRCGLSRERVRQILNENGVSSARPVRVPRKSSQAELNLDPQRIEKIYGCTLDELRKIQKKRWLSDPGSPAWLYNIQRKRCMANPGWDFTFPQWWEVWKPRWRTRVRRNLVLAPLDYTLPVGPANHQILTRSELMRLNWHQRKGS